MGSEMCIRDRYYSKKLSTTFYSCRAGARIKYDYNMNFNIPFAQKWVDHLKGSAKAYEGRTNYAKINASTSKDYFWRFVNAVRNRINRPKPSNYYPVGQEGEKFKIFRAK